jgi:hypothetical protein
VDLSVAADLKVDTIDEYTSDVGVTVDSLLIKDQNIGTSSLYQGVAYLTSWRLRVENADAQEYAYVYSNTLSDSVVELNYRYGGTIAVPAAAPTDAWIKEAVYYAYDGTTSLDVVKERYKVDGSVATNDVTGEIRWSIRSSGGGSLTERMIL